MDYINIFIKSIFVDNMIFAFFLGISSLVALIQHFRLQKIFSNKKKDYIRFILYLCSTVCNTRTTWKTHQLTGYTGLLWLQ